MITKKLLLIVTMIIVSLSSFGFSSVLSALDNEYDVVLEQYFSNKTTREDCVLSLLELQIKKDIENKRKQDEVAAKEKLLFEKINCDSKASEKLDKIEKYLSFSNGSKWKKYLLNSYIRSLKIRILGNLGDNK